MKVGNILGRLAFIKGQLARLTSAIGGISIRPSANESELVWAEDYVKTPGTSVDFDTSFVSTDDQKFLTALPWEQWRSAEREHRQEVLNIQDDQQLKQLYKRLLGDGVQPASTDRNKLIQAILDQEHPLVVPAMTTTMPCEKCGRPTPHKTSEIQTDDTGKFTTLKCSACGTWNKVNAQDFQRNIETPSGTDFSED